MLGYHNSGFIRGTYHLIVYSNWHEIRFPKMIIQICHPWITASKLKWALFSISTKKVLIFPSLSHIWINDRLLISLTIPEEYNADTFTSESYNILWITYSTNDLHLNDWLRYKSSLKLTHFTGKGLYCYPYKSIVFNFWFFDFVVRLK
jgi:hypothetical protein